MENYNLTAEEWFFVQLMFLGHEEEGKDEFIARYVNRFDYPVTEMLEHLQNKGIILKSCRLPKVGEKFDSNNFEFNSLFYKKYMKHSGILGRDLFNKYPMNVYINGVRYSLRNFAKKFNSEWEFFYFYAKMINFNPNEHERVIKILERAKDCNLINFGIKIQVLLYSNI